MKKEYQFAELIYMETTGEVRCPVCFRPVRSDGTMCCIGNRWVCIDCIKSGRVTGELRRTTLCATIKAHIEN